MSSIPFYQLCTVWCLVGNVFFSVLWLHISSSVSNYLRRSPHPESPRAPWVTWPWAVWKPSDWYCSISKHAITSSGDRFWRFLSVYKFLLPCRITIFAFLYLPASTMATLHRLFHQLVMLYLHSSVSYCQLCCWKWCLKANSYWKSLLETYVQIHLCMSYILLPTYGSTCSMHNMISFLRIKQDDGQ
jgi:hypothetical protein